MGASISPDTRLGAVHLTVANLARSLDYYRTSIGLRCSSRATAAQRWAPATAPARARRGAGRAAGAGRTGLFHFALLLPDRRSLALWVAHAVRERVRLAGASDHFVSEAIYLSDPDRHGIEIYADRPRALWEGKVAERMGTDPLDLDGLLAELDDPVSEPFEAQPAGTTMGHVHLQVSQVPSEHRVLPRCARLRPDGEYGSQAAFLSAGGYHHHVGANTWRSGGAGRRRRDRPRCAASSSCCRTRPSATCSSSAWPRAAGRRGRPGRAAGARPFEQRVRAADAA